MLTLQFVPYNEISALSSDKKIAKLIDIVKEDKIVVLEGRLKPMEEAALIQKTMENVSREFKGIELCTVYPRDNLGKSIIMGSLKQMMVKFLVGDRTGLTIVGPASIVKEIKKNPNKIELLTTNIRRKK